MEVNDIWTPRAEQLLELLAGLGVVPCLAPSLGRRWVEGEHFEPQLGGCGSIYRGFSGHDADGVAEVL